MPFGKTLQISGAAAATEDPKDRHQQQQPLRVADASALATFWQGLQEGDQISSGSGVRQGREQSRHSRHQHGRTSRPVTDFQSALPLEPPGLAPLVESDHVDPQLLGDLGHALAMGRPHPPSHIGLDGLAVTTHRSIPSSPQVVVVVGMKRRHLSWQRGCHYNYIFCCENYAGSEGYISEKIFDALAAGSLPLCLGESRLRQWFPLGCVVFNADYRSDHAMP
jgi:hypothetical protein